MRSSDDYSFHAVESKIAEKLDAVIAHEMEKREKAIAADIPHNGGETAGGAS
jgi:hypothetical protein